MTQLLITLEVNLQDLPNINNPARFRVPQLLGLAPAPHSAAVWFIAWLRMITFPNQSSVAKAFLEFDDAGRMKPSPYYDRVVSARKVLMN